MNVNYLQLLQLLLPEVILLVTALAVLAFGLSRTGQDKNRVGLLMLLLAGGIGAGAALMLSSQSANMLNGTVVLDPLTRLFKLVVIGLTLITAVFAYESQVRRHFPEYLALILFATIGMMLLAGS